MKIVVNGVDFEVSTEAVQKAIEDAENPKPIEIKTDDFIVRSMDDEAALIENHKKDARIEGVEIAVKNVRKDLGLDFQGKTIENLTKAVQEKAIADAKIEPNKQIEDLQKDKTALQTKIEEINGQLSGVNEQFTQFKNQSRIDTSIKSAIQAKYGDKLAMPLEQTLLVMKSMAKPVVDADGNITYTDMNGNVMKNSTNLNPLGTDEVVSDFFNKNTHFIKGIDGGAGGGDSTGGGSEKKTVEQFNADMEARGIKQGTPDYNAEMSKAIKEDTYDFS